MSAQWCFALAGALTVTTLKVTSTMHGFIGLTHREISEGL